jgi:hypothetical protein
MREIKFPDITLAQLTAAVSWIAAQAVGMGLIDSHQEQWLIQLGSTVIAGAWMIADGIIRAGRNRTAAAEVDKGTAKVETANRVIG